MRTLVSASHSRFARPGALLVIAAGILALMASLVTAVTDIGAANAQSAPTVDGSIRDAAYASADVFAEITYFEDGSRIEDANGQIWVVETADAYYIAFEQSFTRKSNAYCESKDKDIGCYQDWGNLRGSDHISFAWEDGNALPTTTGGTKELTVGVDIISECDPGTVVKDSANVTCPSTGLVGGVGTGEGLALEWGGVKAKESAQIANAVDGFSSLHYNHNTVGWVIPGQTQKDAAPPASPNFTPPGSTPDPASAQNYVYASAAEVRLDKAGLGLPNGIASQLAGPFVDTHNSPNAPFEDQPVEFIRCISAPQDVNVGQDATITFEAIQGNTPATGKIVVVTADNNGEVVSVDPPAPAGHPGSPLGEVGTTGQDGRANAVVRATQEGTTSFDAFIDLNDNGTFEPGLGESITGTACLLNAEGQQQQPEISVELDKTNDADGDNTFTDREEAGTEGQDVDFKIVITNPTSSTDPIVIDALEDEWPANNPTNTQNLLDAGFCAGLAGDVLAPGDSVECIFEIDDYAPPSTTDVNDQSQDLVDRVTVDVHREGDTSDTDSDDDTSRVYTAPPGPRINVTLDKTNDASGDNAFNDREQAATEDQDVDFRIVITNPDDGSSNSPIVIDALEDEWPIPNPTGTQNLLDAGFCDQLAGETLAVGDSATCTFTITDYAPAPGSGDLTDRVTVDVHREGDTSDTDSANDTSRVFTAVPGQITVDVQKRNDADENGSYNKSEVADAEGQDVDFRTWITNTSNRTIVIDSLEDEWPANAPTETVNLFDECPTFDGMELDPGERSPNCDFTVDDYAPREGRELENTVTVEAHERGDTDNRATDEDESFVRTPDEDDIVVNVEKTNDANDDGDFSDDETAPRPGSDVPFRVIVENNSDETIVIDELEDEWVDADGDRQRIDLLDDDFCDEYDGLELDPGEDTADDPCEFTIEDYSPPAGDVQDNTVRVEVFQEDDEDNRDSDEDDSRVRSEEPEITVNVEKTNDADNDGDYNDSEVAPEEGADVDFRAVVTNTSDVDVRIVDLVDEWAAAGAPLSIDLLEDECADLDGLVLEPGESATCLFTVANYAPPADSSQDNVVTVTVENPENPDDEETDEDDSTVRTPAPGEITVALAKTNDADGDGDFTESEAASSEGQAVEFEALVTNTSDVAIVIRELTDTYPIGGGGQTVDLFTLGDCDLLEDLVLQPGQSERCTFVIEDYAPSSDDPDLVNEVRVLVEDRDNPDNRAEDRDISTVLAPPEVLPDREERPPPAAPEPQPPTEQPPAPEVQPRQHPRTGIDSLGLAGVGLALVAIGGSVLVFSRRERAIGPDTA